MGHEAILHVLIRMPARSTGERAFVISRVFAQAKALPWTAEIQVLSAWGNWKAITPALQPPATACWTHVPSVAGSMKPPLVMSAVVPGFPMTSLLTSTPDFWIWKMDEGVLFRRESQSSYPGEGDSVGACVSWSSRKFVYC